MPREKSTQADIIAIQLLMVSLGGAVDYLPVVAYVMKACGCTYREISEACGTSPQLAEYHVRQLTKVIESL